MFRGRGFTLVEVLLVVIIVGILAAVVIPRITYSRSEAQKAACDANVRTLNSQIELYRTQTGNWPADLDALVTADYIDAVPECPFGTAYVYGADHRVAKHVH